MSVEYAYYKVKKGSKLFKTIVAFYEEYNKQLKARFEFAKSLGFSAYLVTDTGIVGFPMTREEANKRKWISAGRNSGGYYKPRSKGADAKIREQMSKLPCIGARAFTHDKEYLGIKGYLMVGLNICFITPLELNGTYVLSVPAACVGKQFKPTDHSVTELKMSEYYALRSAEEKKHEKSKAR